MNQIDPAEYAADNRRPGSPWGHVLVALATCLLTVSIVGSAVFLIYRVYDQQDWRSQARSFVASLENRTPEELADRVNQLRDRPKAARYVLPEVLRALHMATSEHQRCSAIEISRAFLQHKQTEKALFRLRKDASESVAAAAVRVLGSLEPTEHAAEVLGECLEKTGDQPPWAAVVDEACAGLVRLGAPGRAEMEERLPLMSPDRRCWLAGYIAQTGCPDREKWLELLRSDDDERVRSAADRALEVKVASTRSSAADQPVESP